MQIFAAIGRFTAEILTLTVLGYFEHLVTGGVGAWEVPRPPPPHDLGRRKSDEHENLHVCRYLRKEQDDIISFLPNMQISVVIA